MLIYLELAKLIHKGQGNGVDVRKILFFTVTVIAFFISVSCTIPTSNHILEGESRHHPYGYYYPEYYIYPEYDYHLEHHYLHSKLKHKHRRLHRELKDIHEKAHRENLSLSSHKHLHQSLERLHRSGHHRLKHLHRNWHKGQYWSYPRSHSRHRFRID
ncbi:hypothetical protein HRbin37_02024 [bacterium HR37]|nr:hypothetical protein HRbin37_02024 [bacterium HR37]